jgi:hypothetical protein
MLHSFLFHFAQKITEARRTNLLENKINLKPWKTHELASKSMTILLLLGNNGFISSERELKSDHVFLRNSTNDYPKFKNLIVLLPFEEMQNKLYQMLGKYVIVLQ